MQQPAIANVELSKQNATQSKTIMELLGEVRVLNSKILLNESINDDLQKKLNRKYPRKPYNKKLYRKSCHIQFIHYICNVEVDLL